MSNIDYILNLCFDLSEQGKNPSLALIRNTAAQPLTIPEVIKGLQRWKANPDARPKISHSKKATAPEIQKSIEQRVSDLEDQVKSLTQALIQLQKNEE